MPANHKLSVMYLDRQLIFKTAIGRFYLQLYDKFTKPHFGAKNQSEISHVPSFRNSPEIHDWTITISVCRIKPISENGMSCCS